MSHCQTVKRAKRGTLQVAESKHCVLSIISLLCITLEESCQHGRGGDKERRKLVGILWVIKDPPIDIDYAKIILSQPMDFNMLKGEGRGTSPPKWWDVCPPNYPTKHPSCGSCQDENRGTKFIPGFKV